MEKKDSTGRVQQLRQKLIALLPKDTPYANVTFKNEATKLYNIPYLLLDNGINFASQNTYSNANRVIHYFKDNLPQQVPHYSTPQKPDFFKTLSSLIKEKDEILEYEKKQSKQKIIQHQKITAILTTQATENPQAAIAALNRIF